MHLRKTPEEKQRSNYKEACEKGYCPSLAERENNRIRELANRLKVHVGQRNSDECAGLAE